MAVSQWVFGFGVSQWGLKWQLVNGYLGLGVEVAVSQWVFGFGVSQWGLKWQLVNGYLGYPT